MKDVAKDRQKARVRRKVAIRKHLSGTPDRPRLTVTRTHRAIYAQVINDVDGHTMAAIDSFKAEKAEVPKGISGKCATAYQVGKAIAETAKSKGIEQVVFDRNGYLYHGRIAALAKGARDGGLEF